MSEVSQSEAFSLTWKLENIHLSNSVIDSYIASPIFRVGVLQNTSWELLVAPAGITDPSFFGCCLRRSGSDIEPKNVKIRWKICIIAEGGTVRFETCSDTIFSSNRTEVVPNFIRKSELLPTDTPQNNLTIYCEMTNDSHFSSEIDLAYDLEALSIDLGGLLESGYRSDFKMYCRGEIFNVHKFILLSRWPDFCKRLEIEEDISTQDDIIMTGIESSTLHAFLTFLYTGKLQRADISMELCTYMYDQCCDTLMASLETPASNLEFVTHMHYESKHLIWEVGDDDTWKMTQLPFFRVIPLEEVYLGEMVIVFNFEKINTEEWLRLGASFTGFDESKPVLLDGEISFVNKKAVVCSRKFHHLLESDHEWVFPQIVKKSDLFPNRRNSKSIEIRLCLCDGHDETRQVSRSVHNASRFQEVKDLRKLRIDLAGSSYKKDLKLKIGELVLQAHSPIVASRSEKFREMIQQNNETIEIEEDIGKKAAHSLLRHLYGGRLLDLDTRSTMALNKVAKKYLLASLEEKTTKLLEGWEF